MAAQLALPLGPDSEPSQHVCDLCWLVWWPTTREPEACPRCGGGCDGVETAAMEREER